MDQSKIEIDQEYGYREYPQKRGSSFERIKILEKAKSGKWRVRFLDSTNSGAARAAAQTAKLCRWRLTVGKQYLTFKG